MTYRIIYSSISSTPMQMDELEDLLEQAQSNNSSNGITGALVYVDGFFLQVLEGEKDSLQELMQTISKDFRHENVTVLQADEIPAAAFSAWDMAYVSATPEQVARWAGLSGTTKLPDLLEDLHQDPRKATQIAKSILSMLVSGPSSQAKAD